MSSFQRTGILERIIKFIESLFLKIYFFLAQYVYYVAIVIALLLILEVVTSSEPEFFIFYNFIGGLSAIASLILTLVINVPLGFVSVIIGNPDPIQQAVGLLWASAYAIVGHIFAMAVDIFLNPLFAMFNIFNSLARVIMVPDATQQLENNRWVPAFCYGVTYEGEQILFPSYTVGDIIGVSNVIDLFKSALELGFEICIEDAFGQGAAAAVESVGIASCGQVQLNDIPGLKQAYDGLLKLEETQLIPADIMIGFFSLIQDLLSFLFPTVGGSDLLRHHIFVERLNFDGNGMVSQGQGTDPFGSFLVRRIEAIWGCEFAQRV